MKKLIKFLSYVSFLAFILISFIPAFIAIFIDYKSADSVQIYITLLVVLITFIFSIKANMKKLINIIVLSILNLIFLFIPGAIFYLCIVYGGKLINNQFNDVIYTSFIRYVLDYPKIPGISTWIGPTFLSNLVFILISLLYYLINKLYLLNNKKRSKKNI